MTTHRGRRFLLPVEYIFRLATHSRPVPGVTTFLLAVRRHTGAPVRLPDGTTVTRGAIVGELHLWNERIASAYADATDSQLLWRFVRDFGFDLRRLAARATTGGLPPELVAFFGVGPLARPAARMGFTYVTLPQTAYRRLVTSWQRLLGRVFRPVGHQRSTRAEGGACWISRSDLERRYGGLRPQS